MPYQKNYNPYHGVPKKKSTKVQIAYEAERHEKVMAKEEKKLKKLKSKSMRQQQADEKKAATFAQEYGGNGLSPRGIKIQQSINEMCSNPLEK